MGEPKFTKGPWHPPHFAADEIECNCGYILAEDDRMGAIATVHFDNGKRVGDGGNDCPPLEEAKANARLIAASPEMFEALTTLTEAYANAARLLGANVLALSEDGALKRARAALLKASPGGTKDAG